MLALVPKNWETKYHVTRDYTYVEIFYHTHQSYKKNISTFRNLVL